MNPPTDDVASQRLDSLDKAHRVADFYRCQDPKPVEKRRAHLAALAALRAELDGDLELADAARRRFLAALADGRRA